MPLSQDRMLAVLSEYQKLYTEFELFILELRSTAELFRFEPDKFLAEVANQAEQFEIRQSVVVEVEKRHFQRFAKSNESAKRYKREKRLGASGPLSSPGGPTPHELWAAAPGASRRPTQLTLPTPKRVHGGLAGMELTEEQRRETMGPPPEIDLGLLGGDEDGQ